MTGVIGLLLKCSLYKGRDLEGFRLKQYKSIIAFVLGLHDLFNVQAQQVLVRDRRKQPQIDIFGVFLLADNSRVNSLAKEVDCQIIRSVPLVH